MSRRTSRVSLHLAALSAVAAFSLGTPLALSSRGADAALTSTWRAADLAIDGSIADWPALARVDDGPAVAVQNDDASMFLAVASNDPTVRVQLATGLVAWIDGGNRHRQTFGVRLEGLAPRVGGASTERPSGQVRAPLDAFDLLGPARLQRRLIETPAAMGFEMASGVDGDLMVYELKVPLTAGPATPHAVGAGTGATVALGIETPADPRAPRNRNRLDNPTSTLPWVHDPWGYGGYFTQPPPPPGGWAREPKDEQFKPLKLMWMNVRLATER